MANRTKSIPVCIGENIRLFRRQASLTQKELAEKLYRSESAVRMWELGKSEPDSDTLINMANIFRISVDDILGKEPEKKPTSKVLSLSDTFTPREIALVIAYRTHPNEQAAVDKLLDVPSGDDEIVLYNAAYFGQANSEGIKTMPGAEWKELKNTPSTDQDLT